MNYRKKIKALALFTIVSLCTTSYTSAQKSLESTFEKTIQTIPEGTLRDQVSERLNIIKTACHDAFIHGKLKAYDLCTIITQEIKFFPSLIVELTKNKYHAAADQLQTIQTKVLSLRTIIIQYLKDHGTITGNSVKIDTSISKLSRLSDSLYKSAGDAYTLAKTATMQSMKKIKNARAVLGSIATHEFNSLKIL